MKNAKTSTRNTPKSYRVTDLLNQYKKRKRSVPIA